MKVLAFVQLPLVYKLHYQLTRTDEEPKHQEPVATVSINKPDQPSPDHDAPTSSGVPRTETMQIAKAMNSQSFPGVEDKPNHDFYQEAWFKYVILYIILTIIGVSIEALIASGLGLVSLFRYLVSLSTDRPYEIVFWTPFTIFYSFGMYTLYALLLGTSSQDGNFLGLRGKSLEASRYLTFMYFLCVMAISVPVPFVTILLRYSPVFVYVVLCIAYRFLGSEA
jgi:hypothetical protein